jgi:hypothetical protein
MFVRWGGVLSRRSLVKPHAIALFLLVSAAVFHAAETSTIQFQDVSAASNISFITRNSATPYKNQIEAVVAGVALLDYDQDGFLDIFLVNGAEIPSLIKTSPAYWNRLFHNNHDGTYTDVTERAGVKGSGYGMGVAIGDYDNDGYPDIFVASVTGNQLLHNNGDGTFSDATQTASMQGARYKGKKMWSTAGGWFDYNNDGRLDLFVVNYCVWEVNTDPYCAAPGMGRAYCHPRFYEQLHNTLYRNDGNGHFTDVSEETGIARSPGRGMSVSFADFDGDGYLDAFVANDASPNSLFHNIGGKRFEEMGVEAGVAYSDSGTALSGMGSDFRDVNNDGIPDIWHTAVERETFPLYLGMGKLFFSSTMASGLAADTVKMSGWGNGIMDFDNDGWKDLFVARSNVLDTVSEQHDGRSYPEPNSVFRNLGNGKFEDVSRMAGESFQQPAPHRGTAFGDLDNDGRMDVVVSVLGGSPKILRNISVNQNHWLTVQLVGSRSNRMGLGAQLHLVDDAGRAQWNEATTSVGYASSSDSRVHFGLGTSALVHELEVRWPSGVKQVLRDIKPDRILVVKEPGA